MANKTDVTDKINAQVCDEFVKLGFQLAQARAEFEAELKPMQDRFDALVSAIDGLAMNEKGIVKLDGATFTHVEPAIVQTFDFDATMAALKQAGIDVFGLVKTTARKETVRHAFTFDRAAKS